MSPQQVLALGEVALSTAGHPESVQVAFTALTFLAETHNPESLCDYEHTIRQIRSLRFLVAFCFFEEESHAVVAGLGLLCGWGC